MEMMGGMFGMMALMVIAWLVVLGAIIAGVWWAVRALRPKRNVALDILGERYARGEISREEYESRRRDLAA